MYGESVSPLALLLPAAVYPMLAAIASGLIIYKLEQHKQARLLFWLIPLLLFLSWLAGATGIHTRWQFPPERAMDWLLVASLLPVLATRLPEQIRMSGFGISCLLAFGLIAQPLIGRMGGVDLFAQIIGWMLACGTAISAADRQKNAVLFPVSLIVMIVMSAVVTGIASSLSIAQLTGALAAALGGIWFLNRFVAISASGMMAASQAVMALWIMVQAYAHYYGDVSIYALVILSAPLLWAWDKQEHLSIKHLIRTVAISLAPGLLALWMVWPEQSLY